MQIQLHTQRRAPARSRLRLPLLVGVLGLFVIRLTPAVMAETPLRAGEELTYSVRWAVLPSAGQIRIAATENVSDNRSQLVITTTTETRGLVKGLMPFKAHSESIFDSANGRIVALRETSTARSKQSDFAVRFDFSQRQAWFTRDTQAAQPLELPEGDPADLITTLMKTRLWDLEIGKTRDVLVSYRDEFYLLTVHALKTEKISTRLGDFDTLVLEPRMEKMEPKGMFKRGANVRVWVSRDELRLPVRFQVDFKIGTGIATLVSYTPPADSRAVADE